MIDILKAVLAASLALAAAASDAASRAEDSRVEAVVTLSNFRFRPGEIHLKANEPVRMRLVNASGSSHSFRAPEFFRAVRIPPEEAGSVVGGSVVVAPHGSTVIAFVPTAGRYRVDCGNPFHRAMGMSGIIVVD